jgi:hypothetical protein
MVIADVEVLLVILESSYWLGKLIVAVLFGVPAVEAVPSIVMVNLFELPTPINPVLGYCHFRY